MKIRTILATVAAAGLASLALGAAPAQATFQDNRTVVVPSGWVVTGATCNAPGTVTKPVDTSGIDYTVERDGDLVALNKKPVSTKLVPSVSGLGLIANLGKAPKAEAQLNCPPPLQTIYVNPGQPVVHMATCESAGWIGLPQYPGVYWTYNADKTQVTAHATGVQGNQFYVIDQHVKQLTFDVPSPKALEKKVCLIKVTPRAPGYVNATCNSPGMVKFNATAGVRYEVSRTNAGYVKVVAKAKIGYKLQGKNTWLFKYQPKKVCLPELPVTSPGR